MTWENDHLIRMISEDRQLRNNSQTRREDTNQQMNILIEIWTMWSWLSLQVKQCIWKFNLWKSWVKELFEVHGADLPPASFKGGRELTNSLLVQKFDKMIIVLVMVEYESG
jgi:hypothetical protein